VEKETEEATVVIPKMEAEIVKLTQTLGEEEKVLEEIQENCKGADQLNFYSLVESSFLCHVKLGIGFSTCVQFRSSKLKILKH
jgi:hypothetical protein